MSAEHFSINPDEIKTSPNGQQYRLLADGTVQTLTPVEGEPIVTEIRQPVDRPGKYTVTFEGFGSASLREFLSMDDRSPNVQGAGRPTYVYATHETPVEPTVVSTHRSAIDDGKEGLSAPMDKIADSQARAVAPRANPNNDTGLKFNYVPPQKRISTKVIAGLTLAFSLYVAGPTIEIHNNADAYAATCEKERLGPMGAVANVGCYGGKVVNEFLNPSNFVLNPFKYINAGSEK